MASSPPRLLLPPGFVYMASCQSPVWMVVDVGVVRSLVSMEVDEAFSLPFSSMEPTGVVVAMGGGGGSFGECGGWATWAACWKSFVGRRSRLVLL